MGQAQEPTTTQSGAVNARPYEVRVDALRRTAFRDLHDAIEAAKIAKRDRPLSFVSVRNVATGQVVLEIDA